MTVNTIVSNIAPLVVARMQREKLINLKLSLNDDSNGFKGYMEEVEKIYDFVSINRGDVLFTKFNCPYFREKINLSKNSVLWKKNFTEKYLVKYLDVASRYYEDFYFEDNYFKNTFPKIQQNLKTPYYYHLKNTFHILVNYFYNFILENDIKLFIQHITPHEPNILLLHYICKSLGVRTLFLHGMALNKKMYYCFIEDIEDIGVYKTALRVNKKKLNLEIKNDHRIDLIDREIDLRNNSLMIKKKIDGVPFVQKDRHFFLKKQIKDYLRKNLSLTQKFSYLKQGKLPHSIKSDYNYINLDAKLEYYRNLQNIVTSSFDANTKFVYFPLHWQPELTTMPLGFEYQDQLLALESLSSLLPMGWKVIAKEHLSQTGAMRDKLWFDRFQSIKNVIMVSYETDTYDLIDRAQIVATITGTAGFEAVIGGKPAVIFGAAWYAGCDGVFKYKNDLDLEKISSYKINHTNIQSYIDKLSLKLSDIQVDLSYVEDLGANFAKCNEEKLYRGLSKAIGGGDLYLDDPDFLIKLENIRSPILEDGYQKAVKILGIERKFLKIICCFVPTRKYRKVFRDKGVVVLNKFLGKLAASFVLNKKKRKKIRRYFIDISNVR